MKNKFTVAISWAAVAVCMGIIFFLSSQNASESSGTSFWLLELLRLPVSEAFLRNAAHFLEFTGLAVLVFNAFYQTNGKSRPVLSFAIASAYAATDEFHQLFVDGRACTFSDWITDSLGAACGIIVISIIFYIFSCTRRGKSA